MPNWPGYAVTIIASGPSLTPDDCAAVCAWRDADKTQRRIIAINTTYRAAPCADVLYACDWFWWERYFAEVFASGFAGQLWTQDKRARDAYGVNYIESQRAPGLSRRPNVIHQGFNSGYQAINLAYLWGVSKMILLGYDMGRTDDKSHWHGDHPAGLQKRAHFPAWCDAMGTIASDLKHEGVAVLNASRVTALKCFPRVTLEEALA